MINIIINEALLFFAFVFGYAVFTAVKAKWERRQAERFFRRFGQ